MTSFQESRERHRIYAPARSTVREPGASSPFGPGLWTRLRESDGGCFLLVFLAAGLAIFLLGVVGTWGPYAESLQVHGDPRFFLTAMAFGTVFFLIALRMLHILLTAAQSAVRRKRQGVSPQHPWTSDYPWRPEGMSPDYSEEGGASVFGRIGFFGLVGLFNLVFTSPSPWLLRGIVLVVDLFALLILLDSLRQFWQSVRFPTARMRWTTFPAFVGGRLEGVLEVRGSLRARGPVRATLRYVQDELESGGEGGNTESLEPFAHYEQTIEVPPSGTRLRQLPFGFDVPADLPGTDFVRKNTRYWQVAFAIPVIGPDYEVIFLAPVYEGEGAPPSFRAP